MLYWTVSLTVMGGRGITQWSSKHSDEVVSNIFEEPKVCTGTGKLVFP